MSSAFQRLRRREEIDQVYDKVAKSAAKVRRLRDVYRTRCAVKKIVAEMQTQIRRALLYMGPSEQES